MKSRRDHQGRRGAGNRADWRGSMKPDRIVTGRDVMNAIAEAFDLPEETTRVVIDLQLDKAATITRVDHMTARQQEALVEQLKTLNVEVV